MTLKTLMVGVVAGSMCVSCSSSQNSGGGGKRGTLAGAADATRKAGNAGGEVRLPAAPVERPAAGGDGFGGVAAPAGAPASVVDTSDIPLAPKDAEWSIYCATVADPAHMTTSTTLKNALIQRSGMREWYIVHESDRSLIYYGFYRSINDPQDAAETKRAQADRKRIDELVLVDGGERPFRACHFVQLTAPDPDAPPQWDLVNAPEDRVWTLMVGAYKDSPKRKRLAVEAVREAREKFGEEAYYVHGPTVSNVFIGAWPEDAVVEERVDANEGANAQRDDILVMPPGWKDPGKVKNKQGGAVRAVGQRLVPADPGLIKKIAQYPEMGVNGDLLIYKDSKTGRQRTQGSMLVAIPRSSNGVFGENAEAWADAQQRDGNPAAGAGNPFSDSGYREAVRGGASSGAWDSGQGQRQSAPSPRPARARRGAGSGLRSIEDQ